MPVDFPQNSQPLKEQIKQMLDAEKDSPSKEENTCPTFYPKPCVRNGFRRKKGDSPLVYNLNLKINVMIWKNSRVPNVFISINQIH